MLSPRISGYGKPGGGIRSPKIFFVLKFHVEFEVHNSMKEETYFDI